MKQPYHNYVDEETGEPAGKDFDDMGYIGYDPYTYRFGIWLGED